MLCGRGHRSVQGARACQPSTIRPTSSFVHVFDCSGVLYTGLGFINRIQFSIEIWCFCLVSERYPYSLVEQNVINWRVDDRIQYLIIKSIICLCWCLAGGNWTVRAWMSYTSVILYSINGYQALRLFFLCIPSSFRFFRSTFRRLASVVRTSLIWHCFWQSFALPTLRQITRTNRIVTLLWNILAQLWYFAHKFNLTTYSWKIREL